MNIYKISFYCMKIFDEETNTKSKIISKELKLEKIKK